MHRSYVRMHSPQLLFVWTNSNRNGLIIKYPYNETQGLLPFGNFFQGSCLSMGKQGDPTIAAPQTHSQLRIFKEIPQ